MNKVPAREMAKHLEAAVGLDDSLYCFLEVGHGVVQVPLSVRSVATGKGEFTAWIDDESYEVLGRNLSGSGKLSLLAHGPGTYFESQLIDIGSNRLMRLKLPAEGRFFERRTEDRKELNGPMEVRFTFRGKRTRKLCFDIHEKGMSLLLTREEAMGLKPGVVLTGMSIVLGKSEEAGIAEVVAASKVSPKANGESYYSGVKVSFTFKAPGERFQRLISLVRAQAFAQRP